MQNYTNIQRVRNKVNLGLYERISDLVKYFLLISQYEFKTCFLVKASGTLMRVIWQQLLDNTRKTNGKDSLENIYDFF